MRACRNRKRLRSQNGEPPFLFPPPRDPAAQTFAGIGQKICWHQNAPAVSPGHLQDEDKVVHGFASLEEVVLGSVFALRVELELLDDAGMFDEAEQNLL